MTYMLITSALLTAFVFIGSVLVWGLSVICRFLSALAFPRTLDLRSRTQCTESRQLMAPHGCWVMRIAAIRSNPLDKFPPLARTTRELGSRFVVGLVRTGKSRRGTGRAQSLRARP